MSVHLVAGYPEITRPIGMQCRKCYYCYLFFKFQYKVGYMTLTYSVNINKQVTVVVCKLWRVVSVDWQMRRYSVCYLMIMTVMTIYRTVMIIWVLAVALIIMMMAMPATQLSSILLTVHSMYGQIQTLLIVLPSNLQEHILTILMTILMLTCWITKIMLVFCT